MTTNLKAALSRCRARLRTLDLPHPFTVEAFCTTLERTRGRQLSVQPIDSHLGPFGLLLSSAHSDYIFFARETSPLHQRHIVLHEACHLLFDHRSPVVAEDELLRLLVPDLAPELVDVLLRRRSYTATEEQDAELLASLILEQADSNRLAVRDPDDIESAMLLARLEGTLRQSPPQRQ